jgi:hypothetical protein
VRHIHYELGVVRGGAKVRFDLSGTEANTFIVDQLNYQRYRRGARFEYHGFHAEASPVHVHVPSTGHWHAVVDLGGGGGRVDASVSVIGT